VKGRKREEAAMQDAPFRKREYGKGEIRETASGKMIMRVGKPWRKPAYWGKRPTAGRSSITWNR